jgi:hypothetical protein
VKVIVNLLVYLKVYSIKAHRGRVDNSLGNFVLWTRWRRVGGELDSTVAFTPGSCWYPFHGRLVVRYDISVSSCLDKLLSMSLWVSNYDVCFIFWRSRLRFSTQKSINLRFKWFSSGPYRWMTDNILMTGHCFKQTSLLPPFTLSIDIHNFDYSSKLFWPHSGCARFESSMRYRLSCLVSRGIARSLQANVA